MGSGGWGGGTAHLIPSSRELWVIQSLSLLGAPSSWPDGVDFIPQSKGKAGKPSRTRTPWSSWAMLSVLSSREEDFGRQEGGASLAAP